MDNLETAITRALAQLGPLNGPMAEHHERVVRELVREVRATPPVLSLDQDQWRELEWRRDQMRSSGPPLETMAEKLAAQIPDQRRVEEASRKAGEVSQASMDYEVRGPPLEAPREPTPEMIVALADALYGRDILSEMDGDEWDLERERLKRGLIAVWRASALPLVHPETEK